MTEQFFGKALAARPIEAIPGMIEFDIPVHGDNRGWLKEKSLVHGLTCVKATALVMCIKPLSMLQKGFSFLAALPMVSKSCLIKCHTATWLMTTGL